MIRRQISIAFLFILCLTAYAGPAWKKPFRVTQPDGSSFYAKMVGDEFYHYMTTADGYVIAEDDEGVYRYAGFDAEGRIILSSTAVGEGIPSMALDAWRSVPGEVLAERAYERRLKSCGMEPGREAERFRKMLREPKVKSSEGIIKHGIVILVQFSDDVLMTYKREDFIALLTQEGYSVNGSTGCAMEYFNDQFGGKIDFRFDVTDIITLPNTRKYYGENDNFGYDKRPAEMAEDACRLADASVDFSLYDDDGDGEVENVFIFYAGGDEARGYGKNCIWSHASYIKDSFGIDCILDGVRINRYACTSEIDKSEDGKDVIATIGTFCHEYTHTFGIPDLYDTDYDKDGEWSACLWTNTALMDGGNSNNKGRTPPYYNAVEREHLGIEEPLMLGEGNYVVEPISKGGRFYRIDSSTEGEYYLLECRDNSGWDMDIRGKGLLIYHIDKSSNRAGYTNNKSLTAAERWDLNMVNAYRQHQCVDLVEADSRSDNLSTYSDYVSLYADLSGLYFPGSAGINSFTYSSTPAIRFWDGSGSILSIDNIRQSGSNVTFSVAIDKDFIPTPKNLRAHCAQNTAIISWETDIPTANPAFVCVDNGEEQEIKPYENGHYSLRLEGLKANSSHKVSVYLKSKNDASGTAVDLSFKTALSSGGRPYIYLKDISRNKDGSFDKGVKLPLMIMNREEGTTLSWMYNEKAISPAADGWFTPAESGILKAEIGYEDGSYLRIIKVIVIKEEEKNE